MRRLVVGHETRDQALGIVVVQDHGAGVLLDALDDLVDGVCHAAGVGEHADEAAFVVGDGELPQRSRPAADDDDDVRRANVDDLATHQARARVHNDIESVDGRVVTLDVLGLGEGWRNADHEPPGGAGPFHRGIGQTRTRARDERASGARYCSPEGSRRARHHGVDVAGRRAHDPDGQRRMARVAAFHRDLLLGRRLISRPTPAPIAPPTAAL